MGKEVRCIADEVPFKIPDSWEWVRLGNVVYNRGQEKPTYDFSYIDIGSINNITQKLGNIENIISPQNAPSRARKIVEYGDVIYSTVRPYLHNMCIIDRKFTHKPIASTGFAIMACYLGIYNKFLFYCLMSPMFDSYANNIENSKGVAYPAINDARLYNALIPIPPFLEQHRILTKIEELLPCIEKYEQIENEVTSLNATFPEQLKRSILQQAVMGKLAPQDPSDEPASVLLEHIRAEKSRLIKEGKIKKDKHESVIYKRDNSHYEKVDGIERCIDDEIPFEIPDSWEWVRLHTIVSKEIKRGKLPKYSAISNIKVFAQKCNTKNEKIDLSLSKFLDPTVLQKYSKEEYLQNEDIIINSTGNGTLGRIGKFRDIDRIDASIIVPDSHITVIRLLSQFNNNYLFYTLKYYQPYLEKLGEGSTNQTELKPISIANLLIPIPPITEQKNISSKIDNLLPIIEKL